MDAGGLRAYQAPRSPGHLGLPEILGEFRGRIDEALLEELSALHAAAAMAEGLVSPAHLVIETFPCAQGSQRVPDATTLEKAPKKRSRGVHGSPSGAAVGPHRCSAQPTASHRRCTTSGGAAVANAEGKGMSS